MSVLGGVILPVVLLSCGLYYLCRLRLFFFLHPIDFARSLRKAGEGNGTSPFEALSLALAGTLGVGNIAGVATAITAGGAGAVFWMWASAIVAMPIKYAEVVLAVKHRRYDCGRYHGGAMYYILDADGKPTKLSRAVSAVFACLCLANALTTGNMIQVSSAASALSGIPNIAVGIGFAVLSLIITLGGAKRISKATTAIIPILSVAYLVISAVIIAVNYAKMPSLIASIVSSAFDFRSASAGVGGFAVSRAMRYGVTRGIFSNEAGCGTAPTAHASSSAKSPHLQGCYGIFEVVIDTVVLCSATAFVILLAYPNGSAIDGIELSSSAYSALGGRISGQFISLSVVVFAFATVICQSYYGLEAVGFFTAKTKAKRAYAIASTVVIVIGSVVSAPLIWQLADLFVCVMTTVNCAVLFRHRKQVAELCPYTELHNARFNDK